MMKSKHISTGNAFASVWMVVRLVSFFRFVFIFIWICTLNFAQNYQLVMLKCQKTKTLTVGGAFADNFMPLPIVCVSLSLTLSHIHARVHALIDDSCISKNALAI